MYRALAFTIAFGLTPAFAEDLGATGELILDDISAICTGPCPESTFTAMSSDLDGDGEAEFLDAEIAIADAECALNIPADDPATCSMDIGAEGAL